MMSPNLRLTFTPKKKKDSLISVCDEETMWFCRVHQADGNRLISSLINYIRSKALGHLDSVLQVSVAARKQDPTAARWHAGL